MSESPPLSKLLSSSNFYCHFHEREDRWKVPLPHKRPLSGPLPSLCPHNTCSRFSSTPAADLMFFADFFSSWAPSWPMFCARVLWTEILALNWIRCRQRSNWKTMKRQNREPEPPPKTRFTRSSSFINLPSPFSYFSKNIYETVFGFSPNQ